MDSPQQGISLAVSTVIFALRPHPQTGLSSLWIPLVRRTREPFENRWALPGGVVAVDESLADAAARNLLETTALEPTYLEQLYAFGDVDRSPSGRVVSVVYWALVRPDEAERAYEDDNVRWFPADELPELAFDHNLIVDYALWRLRTKVEYSRIARAFLGETFTLAELREVHEAVLQKPLDPANFRRQVEPTLSPTDAVVSGGRHRPPRLYRYDATTPLADNGPLNN
jgi:8-oxo-dGTP diphosphatase